MVRPKAVTYGCYSFYTIHITCNMGPHGLVHGPTLRAMSTFHFSMTVTSPPMKMTSGNSHGVEFQ